MATGISPKNEEYIRQAVADGRFDSRQQALDEAVELLREDAETIDAIQEGLDSIDRGEGIPLSEADVKLRNKHNIPRRFLVDLRGAFISRRSRLGLKVLRE